MISFKQNILILLALLFITSCAQDPIKRLKVNVSDIQIEAQPIKRYEMALHGLNPQPDSLIPALFRISQEFEIFTGKNYEDPDKLLQLADYLNDPNIQIAFDSVQQRFANLDQLEQNLTELLKYYKYHYPKAGTPDIYTYISGFYFEQPVIIMDNSIIIALDIFLSPFALYDKLGTPKYMQHRFIPERIPSETARALSIMHLAPDMPSASLLQNMIEAGKSLYFTDAMLPETADYLKIGFTPEEIKWCEINEGNIWAFLIERKYLFSNDEKIVREYMMDSPFIPGMPNESPGELGHWVGWQIVRRYMEKHPEVTLRQLMSTTDAQKILRESGYKPRK